MSRPKRPRRKRTNGDDADLPQPCCHKASAAFARLLAIYLGKDEVTRQSIAAMASVVGDPEMTADARESLLCQIEQELFGGDE